MTFAKVPHKRQRSIRSTELQLSVLRALNRRNSDGSLLDIYQLMKAVGYKGTRQAMSCVLGNLRAQGMVEDGGYEHRSPNQPRAHRLFQITDAGKGMIRPMLLPGDTPTRVT